MLIPKFSKILQSVCFVSLLGSSIAKAEVIFSFETLQQPPEAPNGSYANLVNENGNTIVFSGKKQGNKNDEKVPLVYHWDRYYGFSKLDLLDNRNVLIAMDISDDGNVIVGHNGGNSFVWTRDKKMQKVPRLKRRWITTAIEISDDGSTVIGYAGWQDNVHAFRWRIGYSPEDIGKGINIREWRMATRISADGKTAVGSTREGVFIWRENQPEEQLNAPENCHFIPEALSADGNQIGGRCSIDSTMIWQKNEGFRQLPVPENSVSSFLSDMSSDGRRFIGNITFKDKNNKRLKKQALWIDSTLYYVEDEVKKLKPNLTFKKFWISDISANGRVLVGGYKLGDSFTHPWKIKISN